MWPLGKDEKIFKRIMEAKGKKLISQPYLEKLGIRPDFYCPEEDTYYEVISRRHSYLAKAKKIREVKRKRVKISVVNPDGTPYEPLFVREKRQKGKNEEKSYNLIHIDPDFWVRVKTKCIEEGISIRDKIITLLENWLTEKID